MLRVEKLQAAYGASQVLFDIDLEIAEGQMVTLLGRNGMGKTTTVRAIMGLNRPSAGVIQFCGTVIHGQTPERIARQGVGLVPEGRQVFPTLTVRENLVATAAHRRPGARRWDLPAVYQLFPRLEERHAQYARTLSGGEQQMLAIGRALMTNPRLLILDEATEGLAPVIRAEIWAVLQRLKSEGQSILVIDKNLKVLQRIADRHYIIEKGRTVWRGDNTALGADTETVRALVGL